MLAVFVASLMSFEKAYAQLRKDKADAEKFKQMVGEQWKVCVIINNYILALILINKEF